MGRRSTSNAPVIGAIIVIGLIGWLLSRIWLYLVMGGAVVFVAWMARVLIQRLHVTASAPGPRPAAAPAAAGPGPEPYRALIPVDPKVFDEPSQVRAVALNAFMAWARQLPMAPADLSEFVRSVEIRTQHLGRLATTLVERQLITREAPHYGTSRVTSPRLDPRSVDAWALSSQELRSASLYVDACAACKGAGKLPCSACQGTLLVQCPGCKGTRKAYGHASNGSYRLMNCKQCSGKGELKCTACVKGQTACGTCRESGRMEHWLELAETSRSVVQIAGDVSVTNVFGWSALELQDSPGALDADAKLLGELSARGALAEEMAEQFAPRSWLQGTWQKLQPELRPGERIQSQTLWVYELPSIVLSYSIAQAPPTEIRLEGRRLLAPPVSVDQQFEARARRVLLVRRTFVALLLGVVLVYLLRGAYFWSAWVGALAVCLSAAAVAGECFMREVTLGRQTARRWAAASTAFMLLSCAMAVGAEPSLSAAKLYLSMGKLEEAQTELTLLGDPDKESHAQVWADLHLAHALKSSDLATVASDAGIIPRKFSQRASAEQRLFELTQQAVFQYLSHKDMGAARAALAQATPVLLGDGPDRPFEKQLAELRAKLADTEFEVCQEDVCRWKAAFESERDVPSPERQQRLVAARAKVMDALGARPRSDATVLSRLVQIDASIELARAILETPGDEELGARARATASWALDERRKIPLIGAEKAVVTRILGLSAGADPGILHLVVASVEMDCRMKDSRCVGVYLVGSSKETRVLNDSARASVATELLSRALGHPVSLPTAPAPVGGRRPTVSRGKEGGVTVLSRWRDTSLMELRIGEVDP